MATRHVVPWRKRWMPNPKVQCRRCHQPLTNPDSIARELGPICYRRIMDAIRGEFQQHFASRRRK